MTDAQIHIVVPCYNEARRLRCDAFLHMVDAHPVNLIFVDDGSTDETYAILEDLGTRSTAVDVLRLRENLGKGEAVRRGLERAVEAGAQMVGYYDADLSTPPEEFMTLVQAMCADPTLSAVLGSRVARLGSRVQRSSLRHYLGRVYATAASLALGMVVYDTQCGAKVFRVSPQFRHAVETPFHSSWAFDVELLDRITRGTPEFPGLRTDELLEVPLRQWHQVSGSKLSVRGAAIACMELARIARARRAVLSAESQVTTT